MSMFRKPGGSDDTSTSENGGMSSENAEESSKNQAVAKVSLRHDLIQVLEPLLTHYTSYLEKECREKAVKSLNDLRGPEGQLPEDHPEIDVLSEKLFKQVMLEMKKNGVPLEDFSGEKGAQQRKNYSKNFGAALSKAASLIALGAVQDMNRPTSSILNLSQLTIGQSVQDALLSNNKPGAVKSIYADEYRQLEFLGKGGYGKVFRCLNPLDGQEYAIKQIAINPSRIQKINKEGRLETLFLEIKTFAKLNHPNLVRYYHSWLEPLDGEESDQSGTSQGLLDNKEYYDLSSYARDGLNLDIPDAALSAKSSDVFGKPNEHSFQDSNGIKFEESSALDKSSDIEIRRKRTQSQLIATSHRASVKDADDVDEVEEISEESECPQLGSSQGIGEIFWITANRAITSGVTIFIKMSLHNLTLFKYLSPDCDDHCFCYHTIPAAKLCLAILDGVDYLHSQNIVHRDLKPANILLSIEENKPQSHTGFVDIAKCQECEHNEASKSVYITPHISDFGLTARLDDPDVMKELSKSLKDGNAAVGTKLYRPIDVPTKEPLICPKLDIYSLGVIAFELVTKFTTEFERRTVLDGLAHGIFPDGFEDHEMAEGIRNMLCGDRDNRWDSKQVRSWLQGILGGNISETGKEED